MKKTFYRVEKDGKGPYAEGALISFLTKKGVLNDESGDIPESYNEARPTPRMDRKLNSFWNNCANRSDYIFGFESFDSIFAWFNLPEEKEFFKKAGYKIGIYETESMVRGSAQAIALADSLTLIDTRDF